MGTHAGQNQRHNYAVAPAQNHNHLGYQNHLSRNMRPNNDDFNAASQTDQYFYCFEAGHRFYKCPSKLDHLEKGWL